MERSKEISGESLRAMMVRVASTVTLVLNTGRSSRLCQPSSKATWLNASKRPEALDWAPRPRRRPAAISACPTASGGDGALEGALGDAEVRSACDDRAMQIV